MGRRNLPKKFGYDRCDNCGHRIANKGKGHCKNCGKHFGTRL